MWQYNQNPNSDELMHYGVMGMKWGIRRYQNADGSLTAAGRKRYGSVGESYTKMKQAKAKYKSDAKLYSKAYNKATSTASWFQGREVRKAQTYDLLKTAKQAEASRLKYKQSKSNYKATLKKEKASEKDIVKKKFNSLSTGQKVSLGANAVGAIIAGSTAGTLASVKVYELTGSKALSAGTLIAIPYATGKLAGTKIADVMNETYKKSTK